MAHAVFTNNARTTLSGSLTNVATSASVVDGSVFPAPTGGDYAYLTIEEGVLVEIVKLTARSTNTLTITRAQDGTTAQAFTAAAAVSLRLPRVVLNEFQTAIDAKLNSSAVSAFGGTLIVDADASAARTTLGLGTAAVKNTGTSGDAVPLLNAANTFSAAQTVSARLRISNGTSDALSLFQGSSGAELIFKHTDSGLSAFRAADFLWSADGSAPIKIGEIDASGVHLTSGKSYRVNGSTVWHAGNGGAGSGLDADLLDGIQGAGYARNGGSTTADLNTIVTSGMWRLEGSNANLPSGAAYGQLIVSRGSDTILQIASDYQGQHLYFRNGNGSDVGGSGAYSAWRTIWHSGNFDPATKANLSGATFTGALNIDGAPGWNPGIFNVRSGTLGGTATNTSTISTMRVMSGNEDKIVFDAIRNTTGVNWDTASLRIRRMVDVSNHNFLEFANNGTFIGWGATRRVGIYDTSANAMDIVGKLNMTSAMGVSRSTIDWNFTQSGLTIWNIDNTPLSLGTTGVNRMQISATGIITLGTQAPQSTALAGMRVNGNNFEWGHTNTAGYHATLGAEVGTGAPFIALGAEAGTNNNTYRTRGRGATILRSDNGAFSISTLASTNADNQSLVDRFGIDNTTVYVKHTTGDRSHLFRDGYLDTANLANSLWAVFDARALSYNLRNPSSAVLLSVDSVGTTTVGGGFWNRSANNLNTLGSGGYRSGFLTLDPSTTGAPTTDWQNAIKSMGTHWNYPNEYSFELSHPFFADDLYVRRTANGFNQGWRKVLTNSNAQAASGSAASPTFSFESDVNTGMYSAGADALGFSTGGVNRLTIASDGDAAFTGRITGRPTVGSNVNTNNDTGSLSVRSDSSNAASISFHRTGAFAINMGVGTDNVFRIGGWSASSNCLQMDASGNLTMLGNVTAYSDERLKTNIETLDPLKVFEMRGVSFTKEGKQGSGVIAQEIQKVAPELVNDELEYLSVAYGNISGYLIEGVKFLKEKIEALEAEITELKKAR